MQQYHWQISDTIFAKDLINEFFINSKIDVASYLYGFEAALPPKMEVKYLTCYEGSKIVAIAFLQQFQFSAAAIKETNFLKNVFLKCSFKIIPCRLSYCGSLFCIALPGIGFAATCTVANKIEIINALTAQHATAITVIKDVQNETIFNAFATHEKFWLSDRDSTMEMEIRESWNSFDDYLTDLEHKYRQRAKKIRQKFESIIAKNLSLEEVELYENEMYTLYNHLVQKQTFRIGKVEKNYFGALKKSLQNNFIITGYFLEDKLIAFRSAFVMDSRSEIHFIGYNETENNLHQIYFNILFDSIDFAIAKKTTILELGRTAQDAKMVVGALPKSFKDLVFFKSKLFKNVFDFIYKRYNNNDNKLPVRNPFKKVKI